MITNFNDPDMKVCNGHDGCEMCAPGKVGTLGTRPSEHMTLQEAKSIIYDWVRSPEAEYSGADLLTRELIANQIAMMLEKVETPTR